MNMRDIIASGGGASKLARALGLHHTTVLGWDRVPAERVPAVSAVTGIPRHELRPELWEPPPAVDNDNPPPAAVAPTQPAAQGAP
jgi:DNA-binding transcriptional regulator YdaS (Cro superfamily)